MTRMHAASREKWLYDRRPMETLGAKTWMSLALLLAVAAFSFEARAQTEAVEYYQDQHANDDNWAHQAADVGYWTMLPVLALGINADAFVDINPPAALAVGAVAIGATTILTPVVAAGGATARRNRDDIEGCPFCRIVGWVSYGAMLVEAGVAFALAFFMDVPSGLLSTSAILGSLSLLAMATDANQSWREQRRRGPLRARRPAGRTASVVPWMSPVASSGRVSGGVLGIGLVR